MKISTRVMAILVFALLVGGIGLSIALGAWSTKNEKIPATYAEGEAAGEYNPADIRGSYTFGEVSSLFEIPIEDLRTAFRLPGGNPEAVALKELEGLYGDLNVEIGTSSVRLFTALYRGLPYTVGTEDTWLLPEAVALLREKAQLSPEWVVYVESHMAGLTPVPQVSMSTLTPESNPTPTMTPTPRKGSGTPSASGTPDHTKESGKVTGQTTFQDMLDWGISQEAIEQVIGESLPDVGLVIKDWITSKGLTFSSYKTALEGLYTQLP